MQHRHHDQCHEEPARVVGQRNPRDQRQPGVGVRPAPVPGVDHLRIEEHVPCGEGGGGDPDHRARAAAERAPDQQGGPRHHRPGQRDHGRHAEQLRPQGPGVAVAAEREPGAQPDHLGEQPPAAGHREQRRAAAHAEQPHRVEQRRGGEHQHRRHRDPAAAVRRDQRVDDLDEHGRRDEGPGQQPESGRSGRGERGLTQRRPPGGWARARRRWAYPVAEPRNGNNSRRKCVTAAVTRPVERRRSTLGPDA